MYSTYLKCSILMVAAFLSSFCVSEIYGQPGEDLDELQRQMRQLQSRISNLQSNEDPFGKRVRSVGRQRSPKPDPVVDELNIRFYDLSDVFSVAPQYPAQIPKDFHRHSSQLFPVASTRGSISGGGGFGGGGGGIFSLPPRPIAQQQPQPTSVQSARVSVESLVNAVKQTVSPDEWDDANGDASVSILGNTLLISATEPMHEQIANLLDLFREQWGKLKTVALEAYWVEATSADIADLLESDAKNPVVGLVNERKWSQFYSKVSDDKRIAYSASMCGQNGQTLHTVSGRQHFVVTDANPILSFEGKRLEVEDQDLDYIEQSVAGLQPERSLFQEGAALQASPLATRGGKYVILDLHTRVNEYVKSETQDTAKIVAAGKQGESFSVELESRPYVSYRLSTTVRCPNGGVVLAGGMTYDSGQEEAEQPNLYLFVKTAIHTIEEDLATAEKD